MKRIWHIWQRFSKREKGLVVVTLVIFGVVLGKYLVLDRFLERREWIRSQLEIQPQRLEKNLRYIDQKAEIMAGLEKARAELKSLEPLLLTGDTPSVSASDLQQTVQGLASKGGTQVISTRVLNPEAMGPFTRIPIQMDINGQIEQVAGLIQGVESAGKLLVINELNVRSLFTPVAAARQPPGGQPPAQQQSLRVSLIVSGFLRSQAPIASKEAPAAGAAKSEEGKRPGKGVPRD